MILEALRAGYPWASDRLHALRHRQGMRDQRSGVLAARRCSTTPTSRCTPGRGKGLLEALAARAAVVVTDDYPAFFLPRMVAAAASRLAVRLEAVDSNGLLPMRATDKAHPTAFSLPGDAAEAAAGAPGARSLDEAPLASAALPARHLRTSFPRRSGRAGRRCRPTHLQQPAIVARTRFPSTTGSPSRPARRAARPRRASACARSSTSGCRATGPTATSRNEDVTSGLSPYLHFGHDLGPRGLRSRDDARRVDDAEARRRRAADSAKAGGARRPRREGFLDQLVTWRELGFNMCALRPDDLRSVRVAARRGRARRSPRTRATRGRTRTRSEQFEAAATHDPLWNAAQAQLVREGRIHNYLRMLWGKKILEWSRSPAGCARRR